jgi:hypothetical protein
MLFRSNLFFIASAKYGHCPLKLEKVFKFCNNVHVRNTAQESKMIALGSYLFHDVVNQT